MTETEITPERMLGIGIDTGGTYTDAVLIDIPTFKVLGAAKAPTTHHDVGAGITHAIDRLIESTGLTPEKIGIIHVSTTLATNAVLENRGAQVGLFMIGYSKPLNLPVLTTRYLHGGHNILGEEEEPLDVETLLDTIIDYRPLVDSYAVCSAMSIKNPAHEMVAEKAILMTDPKPVFLSHRYSSLPGMEARAATAVMNARLFPVMQRFIEGVDSALYRRGFTARAMILKGDATEIPMEEAAESAAETFASGPAATTLFGLTQTGDRDALVVDVGGTSTDITLIKDGRPLTSENGSRIGKWETHINAVDMHTLGVGGDSHVKLQSPGRMDLGPDRVIPVSMAGDIPDPSTWLGEGNRTTLICLAPGMTVDAEDPILTFLKNNGPATPHVLKESLRLGEMPMLEHLQALFRHQVIRQIGFTPTDALHVLGQLSIGDHSVAGVSAEILSSIQGKSAEAFCHEVVDAMADIIRDAILEYVIQREMGLQMTAFLSKCRATDLLDVAFQLQIPLIGIGAASKPILPRVAEKLGTRVTFPEHFAVGNAIGAVLGGFYSDAQSKDM